jgi:glycosyltransferase involved in cell wall biosynthesis
MAASGKPRVAVVIPAYNAERFLAETLESVLGQSYADWHAWVGDDASTDRTLEVARSFADRDDRVTVLALEPNRGVVATRNRLMDACAGIELVALLDHDDLWRADYLERSVALFDEAVGRGERPGVVASDALILEGGRIAPDTVAQRFDFGDPSDYRQMLQRNSVFARALFSRAAFDATGGFAPECTGADDYDLWLQIMDAGYAVVSTGETLSTYRWGGLSRDRAAMALVNQAVFRRALARGRNAVEHRGLIRRRLLYERAQYARARLTEAARARDPVALARWSAVGLPLGLAAFVSQPGRLARRLRRAIARPGR